MPGRERRAALQDVPPTATQRKVTSRRRKESEGVRTGEMIASQDRPAWKRAGSLLLWALVIVLCVVAGRLGYRYWRVSQLAPRLASIKDKPDDAALGGLVNLRCAAADSKLADYALESPLRCYSTKRRFFLWTAPPKVDGTQLLMYYRVAPGTEGALLSWNAVWKGNGVSYRSAQITGAEFLSGGEKLSVEFKLSQDLCAATGLAVDKRHTAEFTIDEFVKLIEDTELDVPKSGLSHPDLGWPVNLLKRAGVLTPEVHDKLRGK